MPPSGAFEQPLAGSQLLLLHGCWPSGSQFTGVCPHPVLGSHVSSVHLSWSSQLSGGSTLHFPLTHMATPVLHWLPSAHLSPSGSGACMQSWPAMQVSAEQPSASLQLSFGLPGGGSPGTWPSTLTASRACPASV